MSHTILRGKVVMGKGIAGGHGHLPGTEKYNNTIFRQKKFFIAAGVKGIESVKNATINVDITFRIDKPDYVVKDCEWWVGVKESFIFVKGRMIFDKMPGKDYDILVYYPMKSEIKSHPDSIVEILSEDIEGLTYGDIVTINLADGKVSVI